MKKNRLNKLLVLILPLLFIFIGCDDFLDTVPDNRTEIDSHEKIKKLVANSYPRSSYAAILNSRIDFVSDKGAGYTENVNNTDGFYWRDTDETSQDTPTSMWRACYFGVAQVNHALESLDKIEEDESFAPYVGEAKLIRSFSHFLLVNMFSKFYEIDGSNNSYGIPYVTKPETVAIEEYHRGTVAETYEKIEQDLVEGIKEIGRAKYAVPAYHFTIRAANAYAARFYLYKGEWDKVISHANNVFPETRNFIGEQPNQNVAATDPASIYAKNNFQPWIEKYSVAAGSGDVRMDYTRASNPSNLLLTEMSSRMSRNANRWRYATKQSDLKSTLDRTTTNVTGGEWAYRVWYSGESYYVPKYAEHFVKSDITSTSGTIYTIFPTFRNEEVLLNRAEAYAHTNNIEKAIADLNVFARQRIRSYDEEKHVITEASLLKLYTAAINSSNHFMDKYNAYNSTGWDDLKKALILCILDFRRNEFMWEGLRYWDLLRYQIPVKHVTIDGRSNILYPGDDRWVLQIPETAVLSGIELNPRENLLSDKW